MKKNPHNRILKWELKEQHINTVPKFCHFQQYWCKKEKDNKVTYTNYKLFQIKNASLCCYLTFKF